MKKEYDRGTVWIKFSAGRANDAYGYPRPYWGCDVAYAWSQYKQAYCVFTFQTAGFGIFEAKTMREVEMTTLREVYRYLRYLRDTEELLKRVYD